MTNGSLHLPLLNFYSLHLSFPLVLRYFKMSSKYRLCLVMMLFVDLIPCGATEPVQQAYLEYPFKDADTMCPGRYCGRMKQENGTLGECGMCDRGYAPNDKSVCEMCDSSPEFYDWLYLVFMVMISLILHWEFISLLSPSKRTVLLLHLSAMVETALAAATTIFLSEPVGTVHIKSCPVSQLSDWYTMFFNPTQDFSQPIHCTQEIVYPLYSMVLIYYTLSLVFMMMLRPFLAHKLTACQGGRSIYAALYFLPILILIHSVFAGIIYYAFPYITVVISLITNACHLAAEEDQRMKELLHRSFTQPRSLSILLGHWVIHAFGIIAITQLQQPVLHASLIALVPAPTLFYILTVRFTDPNLIFPFRTSALQGV